MIIETIVRFSALGLSQEISIIIGVSQRAIFKHLLKTITLKGHAFLHIGRRKCFFAAPRIKVELIRQSGPHIFVCMVQGHLVATGYRSRDPNRCPRLTPGHSHRRMLAPKHQNWNHQHWSRVLFAEESIVSVYNCNGHVQVLYHVFKRLVDCCIQETDGILGNDDQSGRDWV